MKKFKKLVVIIAKFPKIDFFRVLERTVQYKEMEEETFIDFLAHSTVQVSRKRHVPNILQVRSISFC